MNRRSRWTCELTADRIRGGFQASMLPGTSNSSLSPSTDGGTSQTSGGNQTIIIGSTSPVVSNQSQQQCDSTMNPADMDGSDDIRSTVSSACLRDIEINE